MSLIVQEIIARTDDGDFVKYKSSEQQKKQLTE
jgi:hypothetical protein